MIHPINVQNEDHFGGIKMYTRTIQKALTFHFISINTHARTFTPGSASLIPVKIKMGKMKDKSMRMVLGFYKSIEIPQLRYDL